MDKEKIARINELAKKKRDVGLTEDEHAEHKQLQRQYIDEYRAGLKAQLDQTYIKYPDGTVKKLEQKKDPGARS